MNTILKNKKALISVVLVLIFSLSYFLVKKKSQEFSQKAYNKISSSLGRKINARKVSYSILDGLTLKDLSVKEKDEKTDFFFAEKTEIKLNKDQLLKNNLVFEKVYFKNASIKISKTGADWNFSDILEKLGPSKEPLQLRWNAKELEFENLNGQIILKESANVSFEGLNFKISHKSLTGGAFNANLRGKIMLLLENDFFESKIDFKSDFTFDYDKLNHFKFSFEAEDSVLKDMTLKKINADGEAFNLKQKRKEQTFSVLIEAQDLFLPLNEKRAALKEGLETSEKILGKNLTAEKEIAIKEIVLSASYKPQEWNTDFSIESNILNLALNSQGDIKGKTHNFSIEFSAENFADQKIISKSIFREPRLKAAISETLSAKMKEFILYTEKSIVDFIEEEK